VTLEDETGTANLVLHPRTWERHYPIARRSPAWIAEGKLENRKGVIHLVVEQLWDLADELKQCNPRSRDFR
jgi:error-prone DNA polymerase